MKSFIVAFFILFAACGPKIGSNITTKYPPLSDTAFVLVLYLSDDFVNDGVRIGNIQSGDNGFSTTCSYHEVISSLKVLARKNGANLIKITKRERPDKKSTCDRIWADIYLVPNYKKHEIDIVWQKNRPLTWDDFKGKAPEIYSRFAAVTDAELQVESNAVNLFNKAKFFTKATFYCYSSWVKPEGKKEHSLLKHEQIHFDLVEVYRRMLQKKLNDTRYTLFNLEDAKNEAGEFFKMYTKRASLYDDQTNHGLITEKQKEWNDKIAEELDSLIAFEIKDY